MSRGTTIVGSGGTREVSGVFRTEGPLSEDKAHLYVAREEDGKVDVCVRRGDYVSLMGARQMGKTSLLLKLRRQLLDEGHVPIYVDLSPGKGERREAWYGYFESTVQDHVEQIVPDFSIPSMRNQFDFRAALRQIPTELAARGQIVFLLDEVGAVPSPVAEPFFSTIRAIFSERAFFPEFRRYVFVMAGTFIPDELIKDPDVSPFNIARHIYMSDADAAGVAHLVRQLEAAGSTVPDEAVERVYYWTDGHLYFTQRLCSVLREREPAVISEQSVDEAAHVVTSDENVASIYERLDQDDEARRALQKRVLRRRRPFGDGPLCFNRASSLVARLELLGAVKCDAAGDCVVRNRIYEQALEQYFSGTSRLRKKPTPQRSTSFSDRLAELTQGVLDNVLATVVLAIAAAVIGHTGGFFENQATRPLFIGISVAVIVLAMAAYALLERRRG